MTITDVYYKTFPVDSADQAISLAHYFTAHGVEALRDGNAADIPYSVSCPVQEDDPATETLINQLRKHWKLFWEHSDRELFTSTPIYRKDDCGIEPSGCPFCGAGPVIE